MAILSKGERYFKGRALFQKESVISKGERYLSLKIFKNIFKLKLRSPFDKRHLPGALNKINTVNELCFT